MILRFPKIFFATILCTVTFNSLFAQTAKENPITTAVPFLRLSADARTAAMGDAGVATDPDVNSIFYNVSKTTFNKADAGVSVTYTPWLNELDIKDLFQVSLAGFYKLNDKEALSFGLRNFRMGTFNSVDALGQTVGTSKPNDLAVEAGYSRKLSDKMGVGVSLRYINSNLGDNPNDASASSGSAVAADLTAFLKYKSGWNFGLALTNLGSKINYGGTDGFIPANIALGAAYNKTVDKDNKLSFALDFSKLMVPTPPDASNTTAVDDYNNKGVVSSWFSSFGDAPGNFKEEIREVQVALGTEYSYRDMFMLRAGYFSEHRTKGDRNYVTLGAGFVYKVASLNFSYLLPTGQNTNNNALRNTLRLSVLFDINKTK